MSHQQLEIKSVTTELKLYHWAIGSYCAQAMLNQLVLAINPNMSCNVRPYSLQRIGSPPGPHLKKENVHLFPSPWGNNYVDAYLQSSREDMTLEMTKSFVKSTDVQGTSALLTTQLPWLVNFPSVVCNMDYGRVSALDAVVAGSISTEGDHGIHDWWDQIRSRQPSCGFVCHAQCFSDFLIIVIQFTI